jgi:hypothetical protein
MRLLFITLSTVMTGLLAHGQDQLATAPITGTAPITAPATANHSTSVIAPQSARSQLVQLFGGVPLDSSDAFVSAWCRSNGFTEYKDTAYPYLQQFRKTTPGDSRFDNIPDSILTFIYFPPAGKAGSDASVIPLLSFTLIYQQDPSGKARKEFKNLRKLFRKWTGNSARSVMSDRYGRYKKWDGYTSWVDHPKDFPMLNLNYSVLNKQPDRAEDRTIYAKGASLGPPSLTGLAPPELIVSPAAYRLPIAKGIRSLSAHDNRGTGD